SEHPEIPTFLVAVLQPRLICRVRLQELFMQMMDSYSEDTPFFLATDDPAVEARFKARYGGRLLTNSKRSLDRHAPEGIQDALLDLLLLSQGCEVLGSYKSSFSAMAAHFHMVPLHVVDVCPDAHQVQGPAFREVDLVPEDPEDASPRAQHGEKSAAEGSTV
ncbi:unnamed protein product, partial [Effrenium voratum]